MSLSDVSVTVTQPEAKPRIIYLDLLRILAIFAVTLVHVMPANNHIIIAYDYVVIFCVPVLFMISGALFLDPQKAFSMKRLFSHNLLRIVIAYVFWSVCYAITDGFLYDGGLSRFFIRLVDGPYHFWYLNTLVALYITLPFLRKITEKKWMTEYFLLLWALYLFYSAIAGAGVLSQTVELFFTEACIHFCTGFTGYFLLGHYVAVYEIKRGWRYAVYAAAILLTAYAILDGYRGTSTTGVWRSYFSPHCMLCSLALFVAFKQVFPGKRCTPRTQKAIGFLGKCSFGAFILHVYAIYVVVDVLGFTVNTMNPALYVPLASLLAFAISYFGAALLMKIPVVNRYLV